MKNIIISKTLKLKINKFTKKAIAVTTAASVLAASLTFADMSGILEDFSFLTVHAAAPRRQAMTFSDLTDFAAYSINYKLHSDEYCEDEITLALNQGSINIFPDNYIPLGTSGHPFNGKIYITQNYGNSWWFETSKPLFDYVTDSTVINYYVQEYNTEPIQIELRRKENSEITPLFANHVVEGKTAKATWKIKSALQQQSSDSGTNYLVCNNSGLIGTMERNANVTIEYDNSSLHGDKQADVVSNDDIVNVGLVCGTMSSGSNINLTLTGTNTGCYVDSSEGNAGGLVGNMNQGAVLNISGTYEPSENRKITAANGYAGGIVGYNNGGKITFSQPDTETKIRGTITGKDGAGGIYGYYTNFKDNNNTVQDAVFNMNSYDINCTVKATSAGGIAGVIDGKANITVDGSTANSNEITVTGDTVTDFGGICGKYQTSDLTNTLSINTVTVNTSASFTGTSCYGGAIGNIAGNNAAYINVDSLTHKSSSGFDAATAFGGVVGNAGENGSMLDIGTVTVETGTGSNGQQFNGGGIVGILNTGVLRLSGTTNLQKAPANADSNYGQLVGIRKDSLVYAAGSGSDSGWKFNRSNIDVQADDIGTWGSVIRTDTNLTLTQLESNDGTATGVLDFDTTAHTVTIAAPVTTISSASDFTKTALNMQLKSADKGALKFAGTTDKSTLLNTNLNVSGTINLSGTGNNGLMRDDYKDNISEIGQYTGTISGGTVNLAIGERYGVYTGAAVGRGAVMFHRYNGLISRTGTNAAFSNLTVDGTINVNSKRDNTYVGGFVASVENGLSVTNGTARVTINFNAITRANSASPSGLIVGGMIGDISSANTQNISLNGTVSPTINLTGAIGEATAHSVGGAVGRINSGNAFQINVNTLSVGTNITTTGISSVKNIAAAGFIGHIIAGGSTRTMNLTGLTVSGTNINNTATEKPGGLLGYSWLDTDVNFTANNGLIVSGTNTLTTGAKYVGGLVNTATGHWTVPEKGIQISGMTISNASNSLGLLVHDGYFDTKGLYLELTHKDSYDLAASGLTIPSTTRYDELVCSTGADVLVNGSKGIVSITTNGDLIMDGTSCNTYQNKYNKSNLSNDKSRYYYNLTSIAAKPTKSDGEKLLLWSLNKYAATNINGNFPDSFGSNALTGNFDMEYLSYYPVDVDAALTIGDATFKFYNEKIEISESGTGNSDDGVRTTRGASQHYLMHSGVFRNVNNSVTTSGDIHFKGDIGVGSTTKTIKDENNQDVQVTTTYSGALINGTLSGSLTTANNKEIVFEGLTISNPSHYLFINKMSTNSKLTLSGVRTGGGKDFSNTDKSSSETKYGSGVTAASSLIGDVSGNGIQITFDRMKLDSRTAADTPADWSAQYGTTKSIFSGATFLNKFAVDNNSTGTYDFLENEDWSSGTHNANVTYGIEIKTSVQYKDKQQKYLDQKKYLDQNNFVDPVAQPSSSRTKVYPFDNGKFLPYVKESTAITHDPAYTTREIKVNVVTHGLIDGCGTYNHPYEITEDYQLVEVQQTMRKNNYLRQLRLPKCNCSNDNDMTTLKGKIKGHWCETKNTTCAEFEFDGEVYKYTEDTTTYTWTKEQVSLYLASAYYIIKNDITIDDSNFTGLGASPTNDTTGKYAFRGVIVGAKSDGSITITNKSKKFQCSNASGNLDKQYNTYGLITMSNGCVVKNLTIEVDLFDSDVYNYSSYSDQLYEYSEGFPNYGAVINKIMGGDNIIDNVTVKFDDTFYVQDKNDYKATVGGYVGCVVNGGLIFRNVTDQSLENFEVKKVYDNNGTRIVKTNYSITDDSEHIHIHVNPFVGRVINGYAIRENNSYAFSEDGATYGDGETRANAVEVTMHNTRNNYSIPDIDTTNTNKLTFSQSTANGAYDTITVPDGQALYIMSIIAQSGSGCATNDGDNYAYNISYCGGAGRNYSGNTADNNKATHLASYSNVGTATSTTDADYVVSKLDMLNDKKAVPYIIYKYTNSYKSGSNTLYPARTLTKRTFYVNLVGGQTYYMPDCFRGIGCLGSDNYVDDNMKIFGFNGNGATIDFNTEYFTCTKSNDPYFGKNNQDSYLVCGMAMFNYLQQKDSQNEASAKYEQNKKYQITDFTMQGFITAHHVSTNGKDEDSSPSGQPKPEYFCTAGFVSYIRNKDIKLFNISDINFKKFHINSHSYAGGFFAYTNESSVRIYINNCNADGFKIEGVGRVGGFVGSYDSGTTSEGGIHINTGLDDDGKDSYTSVIKNTIVNNRFKTDNKSNYSAGIVGSVWCNKSLPASQNDQGDHALGTLILRNVTIEGGNAKTNYIGNKNDPSGSSGGIMGGGTNSVKGCLIQNCIVKDIDIYGRYAGGIMGENANRGSTESVTGARIIGCKVTGTLDDNNNPQYTIKAKQYAGGIYGDTRDHGEVNAKYKSISAGDSDFVEYKTDIDGVYIYGYNIYSINEENKNDAEKNTATSNNQPVTGYAAGGITGNNDNDRKIQNCKVEKCVIDIGTDSSSATNTPCAGMIGRISSGTVYGYNLEVKDCDFQTHQWNNGASTNVQKAYTYTDSEGTHNPVSGMKCGNVVGNGNSKNINITAIHVENCPAPDDFNNHNASDSFIIYADYNDVASGNNKGTEMSTLSTLEPGYSNVGEGGLKDYFPNVNVSPVVNMGTDTIITGDGAALYGKVTTDENNNSVTTPTPVIDAIVNEPDSNYKTATAEVKTYIQNALRSASFEGQPNKISTYKTEMGSLPDNVDDFTVLVINSEYRNYSTELINKYIQMATNSSYEFMENPTWSGKYTINVYPCTYNGTKYVINASGKTAGLNIEQPNKPNNEYGSYRYYMKNTHADSNQSDYQFSLMDVQFYNPNTALKEVVYHLYIPVLTKKMLLFEFKSASQSGTDNKASNFANYANTLAESLESWYTAYLHFSYGQTEINSILESGAGLNWNGTKQILFKYQTNTVEAKLDSGTQLVLCDLNNSDKYYYSTLADHRPQNDTEGETDTISFAKFKTSLNNGTDFTPATLNDMLLAQGFTITASVSENTSENIYVITTNAAEADVIDSNRTMYKLAETGTQETYKINVSFIENDEPVPSKTLDENYYLAVRAKGDSVYNYSIRTPATTSGGDNKPTFRRSNADEGNVTNIIMGSLYSQTVTIGVKNNETTSNEITSANHRLDVTLTSMIELSGSDSDKDYILSHLTNENIHLYHSFIINLTAKDFDGIRSEIRGIPDVSTNFELYGNNLNDTYSNITQTEVTGSYIQLQHYDIKKYLSKNDTALITASTHINFEDDWQYQAEFPVQDGTESQIGVNVSAVSNLSYNPDKIRFTNMTAAPTTPNNTYYYIKESDEAFLVYNMKSEILDEYDKVGISSFNYSQQGINPKNFIDTTRTRLPIETTATYSATKIKRSDFMSAEKIQYKLKLYKKTDNGNEVIYSEVSDIADYIDLTANNSVFIKVNSGVTSEFANGAKMIKSRSNELTYTADIKQSEFTRQEDQRITADIDFTVITGEGFKEFANYRFVLSVELLKPSTDTPSSYETITNTYTHDWVVYTNAKINPNILTLSEYG